VCCRRRPALGGGRPAFGIVRLARQHLQQRPLHGDQRIPFDQPLLLEPGEPPAGGLGASAGVGGEREARDQPGGPIGVPGGLGMVDGQLRQTVGFAPRGRPSLELLDQLRLASLQLRTEEVAEQMVVVIPLTMPVQGNTQRLDTR
jgi:hypothetical protein